MRIEKICFEDYENYVEASSAKSTVDAGTYLITMLEHSVIGNLAIISDVNEGFYAVFP